MKVEQSITIQRPAQDLLYRFWLQLDNLPKVMSHVRSVQPIDGHLSHSIVDTLPGAPTVEWDAEIINEVEHALSGSDGERCMAPPWTHRISGFRASGGWPKHPRHRDLAI